MIAELGLAVLWMAAALAALQLFAGVVALRPGGGAMTGLVRPLAVMQGVLVAISFLALIDLFLETDLTVKLVAANSHSMKPFIFKLAGTWGNHEGSMLLWVTDPGACSARDRRRCSATICLREDTLKATRAVRCRASISAGVPTLFILLTSNPFVAL